MFIQSSLYRNKTSSTLFLAYYCIIDKNCLYYVKLNNKTPTLSEINYFNRVKRFLSIIFRCSVFLFNQFDPRLLFKHLKTHFISKK
jgi:hypothetical protein